jgi:hypothetical protein
VSSSNPPPIAASDTSRGHGGPRPTHSSRSTVSCRADADFAIDAECQNMLTPETETSASAWPACASERVDQVHDVKLNDSLRVPLDCGSAGVSETLSAVRLHHPPPHAHVQAESSRPPPPEPAPSLPQGRSISGGHGWSGRSTQGGAPASHGAAIGVSSSCASDAVPGNTGPEGGTPCARALPAMASAAMHTAKLPTVPFILIVSLPSRPHLAIGGHARRRSATYRAFRPIPRNTALFRCESLRTMASVTPR